MIIEFGNEVQKPEQNKIIGLEGIEFINSKITFKGKGNIVYADGPIRLENSHILFNGDDAVIYLSKSNKPYKLVIDLWRETTAYFGSNNYFNGAIHAVISERKNLIVGSDSIFSFGIWLRTADPHLIYDIESGDRINPSKSILLGDHIWVGQNALLLKGSQLGSGCIVSANAVVANKRIPSNTIWAGNPVKQVRSGIFFLGDSAHNFTAKKSKASMKSDSKEFIYQPGQSLSLKEIDSSLANTHAEDKVAILQKLFAAERVKGRFFIEENKSLAKRMRVFK